MAFLRTPETKLPPSPPRPQTSSSPQDSFSSPPTSSRIEQRCGSPLSQTPDLSLTDVELLMNSIDNEKETATNSTGKNSSLSTTLSSTVSSIPMRAVAENRATTACETPNPAVPIAKTTLSSTTTLTTISISDESDSEEEQEKELSQATIPTPPPSINPPPGSHAIYPVHQRIQTKLTRLDKVEERDRDLFEKEEQFQRKRKQEPKKAQPSNKKASKEFRMNVRHFFLTWPQCPLTRQEAMDQLQAIGSYVSRTEVSNPITFAMVVQEQHQDGTPHLHAVLSFAKAKNIKDPRYFDLTGVDQNSNSNNSLTTYHGNYQKVKKMKSSLQYLSKFDKNPVIKGTCPEMAAIKPGESDSQESSSTKSKRKSSKITDEISLGIQRGEKIQTFLTSHPGFALMHKNKIEDLAAFVRYQKATQAVQPWTPLQYTGEHLNTRKVVEWANSNLFTDRPFKQPQLFISGPPNSRKTSFAQFLSTRARTYFAAHDKYFDHFDETEYDLVVFDEFNSRDRDNSVMLSFLDGQVCRLVCRYKNVAKTKNLPVILLCNPPLHQQYVDGIARSAMQARLLTIDLTEDEVIDMENISYTD